MNATTLRIEATESTLSRLSQRLWQRLTRAERVAVAICPIAVAAMLMALVQACEVSIERGVAHRAEQRVAEAARVKLVALNSAATH